MTHLIGLIKGATALAIFIAVSWYLLARLRKPQVAPPESIHDSLRRYEELYRAGELSEEEYKAIRATLATTLRAPKEPDAADFVESFADDQAKAAKLNELLNSERR